MEGILGLWIKHVLRPGLLDIALHPNPSFPATILSEKADTLLFQLCVPLLTSHNLAHPLAHDASLGRRLSSLHDEVMCQPSIRKVPRGGPPSPGRDPKLCDGSGQRQQLIVEAPCVTHPLLPAKPRTAPGCSLCWSVPGSRLGAAGIGRCWEKQLNFRAS